MQLSGKLFAVCGLWVILLGVYFILLQSALLPEDPRFMDTSNFSLHSNLRWLLLASFLMWLVGLAFYVREGAAGTVAVEN